MTSYRIARDYLRRAAGRRQALDALLVVELILRGALRFVGVDDAGIRTG